MGIFSRLLFDHHYDREISSCSDSSCKVFTHATKKKSVFISCVESDSGMCVLHNKKAVNASFPESSAVPIE